VINIFDATDGKMNQVAKNNQPVHPIFNMTCYIDRDTILVDSNKYLVVVTIDWHTTASMTEENKKFKLKISAPTNFKLQHNTDFAR
jgi:hypothetical protein